MTGPRLTAAGAMALVVLLRAQAAEPVKQTPFSINDPFEIPSMILEPGHYVFKLVEREPQRNVLDVFETVQLWTGDETRLISTLLTMPNYDQPTTDKTVFTFFERGPKEPKALRIWFVPGRNYGQEFVYPKLQAIELAKSVGRGVLSLPPEVPGDLGKLASAIAQANTIPSAAAASHTPSTPVAPPIAAVPPQGIQQITTPPAVAPSRRAAIAPPRRVPTTESKMIAAVLPKTASYLVILATLGLLAVFAGVLLRILALRLEQR